MKITFEVEPTTAADRKAVVDLIAQLAKSTTAFTTDAKQGPTPMPSAGPALQNPTPYVPDEAPAPAPAMTNGDIEIEAEAPAPEKPKRIRDRTAERAAAKAKAEAEAEAKAKAADGDDDDDDEDPLSPAIPAPPPVPVPAPPQPAAKAAAAAGNPRTPQQSLDDALVVLRCIYDAPGGAAHVKDLQKAHKVAKFTDLPPEAAAGLFTSAYTLAKKLGVALPSAITA
jgi:hypothetical protein